MECLIQVSCCCLEMVVVDEENDDDHDDANREGAIRHSEHILKVLLSSFLLVELYLRYFKMDRSLMI